MLLLCFAPPKPSASTGQSHLVDNLLLLVVLLAQDSDFAPQGLILLLHRLEARIERILPAAHILHLAQHATDRLQLEGALVLCLLLGLQLLLLRRRDLALDVLQQVRVILLKARMGELHLVLIEPQTAIVDRGDFVETIYNCKKKSKSHYYEWTSYRSLPLK